MSSIWPTKVRAADVPLLRKLADQPKLHAHVPRVWKLVRPRQETLIAATQPAGAEGLRWRSLFHAGQGLTLGGSSALGAEGNPVYRGQHIFPTGLAGAPPGRWDGIAPVRMKRFHLYDELLDRRRLFAGRKIAQLPTVAQVDEEGALFQDTVIAIQLATDLPLHIWVLGRSIQWYAAKLVRSGIIEDLGASWHKRQYLSLPAPAADHQDFDALLEVGRNLLAADLDLADSRRHVDDAMRGSETVALGRLIADGDLRASGFALLNPLSQPAKIKSVWDDGEFIRTDNPSLGLRAPDANLRRLLIYNLRLMTEGGEGAISIDDIVGVRIPTEIAKVVAAIDAFETADRQAAFDLAHVALDRVVGEILGLSQIESDEITAAMLTEPFLREIRPSYAYRGYREQSFRADGTNPYR